MGSGPVSPSGPEALVTLRGCRRPLSAAKWPAQRGGMSTLKHPPVMIGFLERRPRIGTALTLVLLVVVGAAVGGGIGLLLTEMVKQLVAMVVS